MPGAGRLGDKANIPGDAHGCPGCPHPATGPAISGSGNVNINGRPALRVGDSGMHAACCGPNTWQAVQGAPTVFINGNAAYRMNDPAQHCGGIGKLVEGSGDVIVGDACAVGGGGGNDGTGGGSEEAATASSPPGGGGGVAAGTSSGGGAAATAEANTLPVATIGLGWASYAADSSAENPAATEEKKPRAWVGLRVLDEFGQPLSGATVRIHQAGSVVATVTVGDSGHLRIDDLPESGDFEIEVLDEEVEIGGDLLDGGEPAADEEEMAENDAEMQDEFGC